MACRKDCSTAPGGKDLDKRAAKQDNLCGEVDPHQQRHQCTRSAKSANHSAIAQIETNPPFAQIEEHSGNCCTRPDVVPANFNIGYNLIEQGKEQHDLPERDNIITNIEEQMKF